MRRWHSGIEDGSILLSLRKDSPGSLPGILHCEIPVKINYLAMWLVINKLKARLHLSGDEEQEFLPPI